MYNRKKRIDMDKELLRLKAERTFIKKVCDRTDARVKAAVITASSKMSSYSGQVDEVTVIEELINAYKIEDDRETVELIGMEPEHVQNAIGYEVDFNDMAAVSTAYALEKEDYDYLYEAIKVSALERQRTKGTKI